MRRRAEYFNICESNSGDLVDSGLESIDSCDQIRENLSLRKFSEASLDNQIKTRLTTFGATVPRAVTVTNFLKRQKTTIRLKLTARLIAQIFLAKQLFFFQKLLKSRHVVFTITPKTIRLLWQINRGWCVKFLKMPWKWTVCRPRSSGIADSGTIHADSYIIKGVNRRLFRQIARYDGSVWTRLYQRCTKCRPQLIEWAITTDCLALTKALIDPLSRLERIHLHAQLNPPPMTALSPKMSRLLVPNEQLVQI
jgi:hypothetical protein